MSQKVLEHFERCFTYALAQTKGNSENDKTAVLSIIPHSYEDHEKCGKWCGFPKSSSTHKHKYLPYGKDLTDPSLREDLDKFLFQLAECGEKTTFFGSSQSNETLHNIIGNKALKVLHYGESESMDFRSAAAVCQRNEGYEYTVQGREDLGIPSSAVSRERRKKLEERKLKGLAVAKSVAAKQTRAVRKKISKSYRQGKRQETGTLMSQVCYPSQAKMSWMKKYLNPFLFQRVCMQTEV